MAGKNRRSDLQLANDRWLLAQLSMRNPGASSTQLAEMFQAEYGREIAPRTVRYDLQELKKEWAIENKQTMELVKAQELARVDNLEQQAWDAWRNSMAPAERVVVERLHKAISDAARGKLAAELASELADKNDYLNQEVLEAVIRDAVIESLEGGEDSETFVNKITTTTEGRVGDPKFLALIHQMQQERRKILGVYAPELHQLDVRKIELKGYAGGWSPDSWKNDDIIEGDFQDGDQEEVNQLLPGGNEEPDEI